nr:immunoglobulin heavy chain junction region [Macaca mulatta]MOV53438.1 immunoglobulin heavy chain junction region [Macaca mulatta]MOV56666.1 immunoglobulin heavy chain junction region [Macaca mulatta]MOV57327.1 immunoglobulin heavy chain junction region [Macaca mulatta]MOV57746.1 immunoglobulin heavy chain junction region [Macaca mulatta]
CARLHYSGSLWDFDYW